MYVVFDNNFQCKDVHVVPGVGLEPTKALARGS